MSPGRVDLLPLFADAAVPHADDLVAHFARRTGGVSSAPFDRLNLGFSTGDDPDAVIENRQRVADAARAPLDRWVVPGQVHGADVWTATARDAGAGARAPADQVAPHDAVYLPETGLFALALSADCPLIVVVDPERRRAGVAHAGWRGTVAGVIGHLLATFDAAGSPRSSLWAAIGPGIGGCCYPVGDEVFAALAGRPGFETARQGQRLDLRAIHRAELEGAGLAGVTQVPDCSACRPDLYFSHRRDDGRTGRNGAIVGWRT